MPTPSRRSTGIPATEARRRLAVSPRELELAVELGLLRRLGDRSLEPASLDRAETDPAGFRVVLDRGRLLTVPEAARRAGVPVGQVREALESGALVEGAAGQGKYGERVPSVRTGDLDDLVGSGHFVVAAAAEALEGPGARRPLAVRPELQEAASRAVGDAGDVLLPDEEVAEALSLPVELVGALRPDSGWRLSLVSDWREDRPAHLENARAARAEVRRRAANDERRRRRQAERARQRGSG